MSNYLRATRECSVTQLRPELQQALQSYFQSHDLGVLEQESLSCCETHSEKMVGSWLLSWLDGNPDLEINSGIVLTGRSLVWVRVGSHSGAQAAGAELTDIRVKMIVTLLTKDPGLEIIGLPYGAKVFIRGLIALGPEPASQKL